jgi:asparagine synthase (glutamine-hydrolysing)
MCGIFYYQRVNAKGRVSKISVERYGRLFTNFAKMSHRGPDDARFQRNDAHNVRAVFGFHRLAVNGLSDAANQPFDAMRCKLICNGEIYNYRELIARYDLGEQCLSNSDCEVIIPLYRRLGMEAMLNQLDGVFSMVLYDKTTNRTYVARDPMGVRSLFIGVDGVDGVDGADGVGSDDDAVSRSFSVASEMKALSHCGPNCVTQFPAGCYYEYDNSTSRGNYFAYYKYLTVDAVNIINVRTKLTFPRNDGSDSNRITARITQRSTRSLLIDAVQKRLMSDRPIGALLSGGLDSSLITAIICKHCGPDVAARLNTYSIGLRGSIDLIWAKRVAEFLGTVHHEVCLDASEFLAAIEPTIVQIESYDTTTVRASVGNYLVSKYISNATDDVVIYCGDMSDELFGSYRGFTNAADDEGFEAENARIVQDVRFFDLLRSDKSISGCGLEARVPFADKAFIEHAMTAIHPRDKRFSDGSGVMEKAALRLAFEVLDQENAYLPRAALWRHKEAFSDGVSAHPEDGNDATETKPETKTWIDVIREYVDSKVSDTEYLSERGKYPHNTPYDKESYYYRKLFDGHYPGRSGVIPYFWRHPFCSELDPSARLLGSQP